MRNSGKALQDNFPGATEVKIKVKVVKRQVALVGWESITLAEKFSRRISHFIFNWEKCLSFWTSQFFLLPQPWK